MSIEDGEQELISVLPYNILDSTIVYIPMIHLSTWKKASNQVDFSLETCDFDFAVRVGFLVGFVDNLDGFNWVSHPQH